MIQRVVSKVIHSHVLLVQNSDCNVIGFLSGSTALQPVDLEYDRLIPANGNKQEGALVILHGFLCVRV